MTTKTKNIPVRKIRSAQKGPLFAESFSIRDLRDLHTGNDLVQGLHRHEFFFILALQKGKGTHEIDFTNYKVCNNSVFFMRPGQVHQLHLKAECTGYLMEFNKDFYRPDSNRANQRLRKASNKNFCRPDTNGFKKIHAILTSVFREYNEKKEGYPDAIKANLDIFFVELVRQSQNPKALAKNIHPYIQERFEEFLELLEIHIAQLKLVSQYAGLLNLSLYQLNAITKTAIGKTASCLIDEHIILEAKRYLLATADQVKDIADQLGYEDVSYFIRFFRRHTGYSPEAFRNNFR